MNTVLGVSSGSFMLDREDITRGYTFDAYDVKSEGWYRLCRRQGIARFTLDPNNPLEVALVPEDGWVSTGLTQNKAVGDTNIRISQQVARWADGWSMVTPRPGRKLDPDERRLDPRRPEPAKTTNLKLEVSYQSAPGTLPPQRFGRGYYLRARAVDLAGNPTPFEAADATGLTHALGRQGAGGTLEPEVYRRFEPVPPPTVIPREAMTEGESVDVLVIRTNYDVQNNADTAVRHIFPPTIDQFSAEAHGVLDTPAGLDPNAFEMLAARAGRSVDEANPAAKSDPRAHGAVYLDDDAPQWVVEADQLARFPGLPDPLSRSAAFRGLPGDPSRGVLTYTLQGQSWPGVSPLMLEMYESAEGVAPELIEDQVAGIGTVRVLRVGVPKGGDFEVALSSGLNGEDLDKLGVWDWIEAKSSLLQDTISGGHWAITPARKLRLINATRQPLVPTEFTGLHLAKAIGDTHVTLLDTMSTSRKSTERVDVRAAWTDVVDHVDPKAEDPARAWDPEREVAGSAVVVSKPIELDPNRDGELPIEERQDFHHTRHLAQIEYTTEAATRFSEYLEYESITLNLNQSQVVDSRGVVPSSETVINAVGAPTVNERGVHYEMDYPSGRIIPLDDEFGNRKTAAQVTVRYQAGAQHPHKRDPDHSHRPQLGAELGATRHAEGSLRRAELQVGADRSRQRDPFRGAAAAPCASISTGPGGPRAPGSSSAS